MKAMFKKLCRIEKNVEKRALSQFQDVLKRYFNSPSVAAAKSDKNFCQSYGINYETRVFFLLKK
jgi:hypothetical protein